MRILHWLEIRNFKGYRSSGRIPLEHPSVLIGPNNCGKTTALQAIALWTTAVRTSQQEGLRHHMLTSTAFRLLAMPRGGQR